ncbi:MAG: DUF928 domain-containing protein [Spirulinaceae cyanobacterium]
MFPRKFALLSRLSLLLCLPGLVGWSEMTVAAPANPQLVSLTFPPTADRGAPSRSTGGGTRQGASCGVAVEESLTNKLTALAPSNNVITTVAANPSIYVHVPSFPGKEALFRVIDRDREEVIYEKSFTLTGESGFLKLNLPDEVELAPNIKYEWGFFVLCDLDDPEQDQGVEGWIERVPMDTALQAQLEGMAMSLDKAQVYAENEVWSETLEILLGRRDEYPTEWLEFVTSVELSPEMAASPIVE